MICVLNHFVAGKKVFRKQNRNESNPFARDKCPCSNVQLPSLQLLTLIRFMFQSGYRKFHDKTMLTGLNTKSLKLKSELEKSI